MLIKKKGDVWKALKEANALAFRANRKIYLLCIFLYLLMAGNTLASLAYTEYNVNAAYKLLMKQSDLKTVGIGMFGYVAVMMLYYVLIVFQKIQENRLLLDVSYEFERSLNEHLGSIKWDYYESNDTYLKIHEVRTKTLETMKKMIKNTFSYIGTIPLIFIYGYFLFQINIFAVIIYLVIGIAFNISAVRMCNRIGDLWHEIQVYTQKQSYFSKMCGDKVSHQEFKFNRLFGYITKRWEELYNCEYKTRLRIFKKVEITIKITRLIFYIPRFVMLIFVAHEIIIGKHEIGFWIMVNTLLNNITNTMTNIQNNVNDNIIESKFIEAYDDICKLECESTSCASALYCDIDLNDVTYIYPQSDYRALDRLSLHIARGEKIAVVGVNGSGKTTCMNLLMSLTKQYQGNVTQGIERSVSCIIQDFAQYQMTVRENIAMGYPEKNFSDNEIFELLEQVGLKEIILKLEKGIDTPLGQLEKGVELSKGQWQRLATARLLANPHATIWILDEPTAYLDPISEIDIYDMIYKLAGDRTVLFISHRLGFAKKADRIVVFEKGKIIEQGKHTNLLEQCGVYAKMYNLQESWYSS